MKLVFSGQEEDKKNFCNQLYFESIAFCQKGEFEVEFKKVTESGTLKPDAGYWRLATNLAPYFQKKYGEICDKDSVSDLAKLGADYSQKISKTVVPKSLTKATKEEMGKLIEQLYKMCEFFEMKDYELTSSETRAMFEYYK